MNVLYTTAAVVMLILEGVFLLIGVWRLIKNRA